MNTLLQTSPRNITADINPGKLVGSSPGELATSAQKRKANKLTVASKQHSVLGPHLLSRCDYLSPVATHQLPRFDAAVSIGELLRQLCEQRESLALYPPTSAAIIIINHHHNPRPQPPQCSTPNLSVGVRCCLVFVNRVGNKTLAACGRGSCRMDRSAINVMTC
jgi:hypothetical protein